MAVWAGGAVYALLGALSVAELAAMRPRSGGLYPLVHEALGSYPGFIVGWTDWLATCGSMAAVAIVLGEYSGPLLPPLAGHEALTASVVVVMFALLQWRGIRIGDAAQQVTSLIKALALVTLALVALLTTVHSTPSAAAGAAVAALPSGVALAGAIIIALQSVIVTYDGWTGPIYFGEELHDPGRDIPRAMIGGVLLVLVIYLALNAAFLRVLSIQDMAGDPFVAASAAVRLFGQKGDTVLRVVMILSLIASVNAQLLIASRVPFAMSRDALLPAILHRVNRRRYTSTRSHRQYTDRARVYRHEHIRHRPRPTGLPFRGQLRAHVHRAIRVPATHPCCRAAVPCAWLSTRASDCSCGFAGLHGGRCGE
jgi:APA family basic amino acid/polyamine antiporter